MTQTLAVGTPPQWAKLSGNRGPSIISPEGCIAFIFSEPNAGKTYFLTSNPDLYMIGSDLSSVGNPNAKALVWPRLNPVNGRPIDDSGKEFTLTADLIFQQRDILLGLAKANEPRPRVVAFDSFATLQPLMMDFVVRNAVSLGIASAPVDDFRKLYGPAAWAATYDLMVNDLVVKLRNAGYGVYLTGHATQDRIPLGEGQMEWKWDLTMGDGLWTRLFPLLELSLCLYRKSDYITEKVPQPDVVHKGVTLKQKDKEITKPISRFYLSAKPSMFQGIAKCRVPEFEMELPAENPWDAFIKTYSAEAARIA